MNIWLADIFIQVIGGFAYFPKGTGQFGFGLEVENDNSSDVVIMYSQWGSNSNHVINIEGRGRTGTHEIGHYLGLLHTFDKECLGESLA